ncbi:MAG: glutamine--scyllo-inositol aminotransferase [Rickettsiales bacterium]|nr:glutamine--scyllo-inositol aminotransferase [Rickettsiales bacterium]|tara:strand:+ start:23172 stop:24284 length:1113 start_codon:yes stop_codon:yes gene_type:complete
MHKIIPVAGPSITKKEIDYVTDAVANGWNENANSYISRFEEAFKSYLGRKYAISLPSCTSGLHLSLLSLGIGPGDEVIVPDATWIASSAPISYVGATPIFADIDPETWCLSTETVKPLITKKTKAIISVNLYGCMPKYDNLLKLGIPIIEDAAESIGSKYKNKLSGTFGVTSCFSFHGSKTMTTGEGGMLVTDDDYIYERCMILRDHGRKPGDILFQNQEVGFKYKMSNLQAALGLAQLERIEELVGKKREIFFWYKEALEKGDAICGLNPEGLDVYNSFWMTTVLFKKELGINKFNIVKELQNKKISTRPFFSPLSSLDAYRDSSDAERAKLQNKNSYDICSRGVNLPSSYYLSKDDVLFILDNVGLVV